MLIKILHPYLVSFICITSQFAPCIAQQLIIIPCASCQMMQLVVEFCVFTKVEIVHFNAKIRSVEIQVYYMTVVVRVLQFLELINRKLIRSFFLHNLLLQAAHCWLLKLHYMHNSFCDEVFFIDYHFRTYIYYIIDFEPGSNSWQWILLKECKRWVIY